MSTPHSDFMDKTLCTIEAAFFANIEHQDHNHGSDSNRNKIVGAAPKDVALTSLRFRGAKGANIFQLLLYYSVYHRNTVEMYISALL